MMSIKLPFYNLFVENPIKHKGISYFTLPEPPIASRSSLAPLGASKSHPGASQGLPESPLESLKAPGAACLTQYIYFNVAIRLIQWV